MKALMALVPALIFSLFSLNPTFAEAEYSQLQIKIERYTSTSGEINVSSYLNNIGHYVGYRLVAVEVIASALNESAGITVHINNTRQGPTLQLGEMVLNYHVFPNTGFFIGHGAENIQLRSINPAYVKSVNLILTL